MGYSNRDIKNLIATLKDSMLDKYLDLRKINPNVKLDDVKLTKEMIEYGLKKNPASTKKSDIDRINEFKERGE